MSIFYCGEDHKFQFNRKHHPMVNDEPLCPHCLASNAKKDWLTIDQQAKQLKVFVEALVLIRMVAKVNPPDPLILQTAEKALLPQQESNDE